MDGDGRKEFLIINYSTDRSIVADDPFIYIIEEGSVTSVEEQKLTSPDNFALYPNYPNPFNSSTTIRFDITQDSQVALRIYDVMGREIKTLFEGALVRGAHRMIWNGRDNHGNSASSGIYLLRIQAGLFSQVREMTLLR